MLISGILTSKRRSTRMKLTHLVLAIVLAPGIASVGGLRFSARLQDISFRSNLEAVVELYNRAPTSAAIFACAVSSICGTPIVNARSMWGN